MNKRSIAAVILLTTFTFGIYGLVWLVKTKNEMNKLGQNLPTAWWWLIPFGMIWWQWKWAGGVEHVTRGKQSQGVAFIVVLLLSSFGIGLAIVQSSFNKAIDEGLMGQLPQARVA